MLASAMKLVHLYLHITEVRVRVLMWENVEYLSQIVSSQSNLELLYMLITSKNPPLAHYLFFTFSLMKD